MFENFQPTQIKFKNSRSTQSPATGVATVPVRVLEFPRRKQNRLHTRIPASVVTFPPTHVYVYTHTYIHKYVYTCIFMCVYMHACMHVRGNGQIYACYLSGILILSRSLSLSSPLPSTPKPPALLTPLSLPSVIHV